MFQYVCKTSLCLLCVFLGTIVSYVLPLYYLAFQALSPSAYAVGNQNHQLLESLLSAEFKRALLLNVAVSVPVFYETIVDCGYPVDRLGFLRQEDSLRWYTKAITLAAITGPNLIILMGLHGNLSVEGYYFFIFNSRIAIGGCAMAYASQIALKHKMKGVSRCCLSVVVVCFVAFLLQAFGYMMDPATHRLLDRIAMNLRLIANLTLVYGIGLWLCKAHSAKERVSVCEAVLLAKLVAVVVSNWSDIAAVFSIDSTSVWNASNDSICASAYFQMFYTVMAISVPDRILRLEAEYMAQSFAKRQAFFRYISHEIRSPLNTVFLGLEFVGSVLKGIAKQELNQNVLTANDTVSDIYDACEVAMSILNDIVTSNQLECGKMNLELEDVNCCAFFASVAKIFNGGARAKGVTFSVDFNLLTPDFFKNATIHVDKTKMAQVFRNLVCNALKFTPRGGNVTVVVTRIKIGEPEPEEVKSISPGTLIDWLPFGRAGVAAKVPTVRDTVRVEIRDTGAGISPVNQTKLFGQYVQFDANKLQKGGGSGLGLWISKGIVELHNGLIGGYSEGEGKGSVFHIELPVIAKTPSECHDIDESVKGFDAEDPSTYLKLDNAKEGISESLFAAQLGHTGDLPEQEMMNYEYRAAIKSIDDEEPEEVSYNSSSAGSRDEQETIKWNAFIVQRKDFSRISSVTFQAPEILSIILKKVLRTRTSDSLPSRRKSSLASSHPIMVTTLGSTKSLPSPITDLRPPSIKTSPRGDPCDPCAETSQGIPLRTAGVASVPTTAESTPTAVTSTDPNRGTTRATSPSISPSTVSSATVTESARTAMESSPSTSTLANSGCSELFSNLSSILGTEHKHVDNTRPFRSQSGLRLRIRKVKKRKNVPDAVVVLCPENMSPPVENQLSPEAKEIFTTKCDIPFFFKNIKASPFPSPHRKEQTQVMTTCQARPTISPGRDVALGGLFQKLPQRPLHFMIVDDVLMNRRMVRRFLSTADYIVSEAKDGKDCLKVWEEVEAAGGRIDVVLMDKSMSVMTGPEAASEMRARGFTGIIIGVTGHVQAADIEDFERCGANAVLPKPLRFDEVTSRLGELFAAQEREVEWSAGSNNKSD